MFFQPNILVEFESMTYNDDFMLYRLTNLKISGIIRSILNGGMYLPIMDSVKVYKQFKDNTLLDL